MRQFLKKAAQTADSGACQMKEPLELILVLVK